MRSTSIAAGLLALTALAGGVAPSFAATAATPSDAGTVESVRGSDTSVEHPNAIKPTSLVVRNTTAHELWIYAPLGGNPAQRTEFHLARLAPGQEFTATGSNSGTSCDIFDVYLRLYTVKTNADGERVRDTMIGFVGGNNPWHAEPFLVAGAGSFKDNWGAHPYTNLELMSEHETHSDWSVPNTDFRAWIHRDADRDGHKIMKMTITSVDLRPSHDSDYNAPPV